MAQELSRGNRLRPLLILLLIHLPTVLAWITSTNSLFPRSRCLSVSRSNENGDDNNSNNNNKDILTGEERRTKRNKYGQFSKTDNVKLDPLEALIAEAEIKIRELQAAKNKKQPRHQKQQTVPKTLNNTPPPPPEIQFPNNKLIDPYDPSTFGCIELGTIVGGHGVHGLVKIAAVTDFPQRLCRPGIRHLKPPKKRAPRKIVLLEGRQTMNDEYLIKLEGIEDREAANRLRGCILYARQEERPDDFAVDEYMLSDLIGLDVFLEDGFEEENDNGKNNLGGKFVGTVGGIVLGREMSSVPELAHDMLEIVLPRGRSGSPSWKDEYVLIPFVPQIVPRIDLKIRAVYISPPDGLLDLTYIREEKVQIKGYLPSAEDRARQS